jgi:hypothetical protein
MENADLRSTLADEAVSSTMADGLKNPVVKTAEHFD